MARFGEAYTPERYHGAGKLVAMAAAHHRLMWIHPFLDGNGRVARLFTEAYFNRGRGEDSLPDPCRRLVFPGSLSSAIKVALLSYHRHKVWPWVGTRPHTDKNVGGLWSQVPMVLRDLCADVLMWMG